MDSAITVTDLIKKFGAGKDNFTAVNNISFDVKKGEIFAFLGPNGAGKSTTIKMLTTLLKPTSGSITLDGFDPTKDQDNARKSFGIVFQDPSLDEELTAFENLEFHGILYKIPKKLRRQRIDEMLKIVELSDRRDSLVKTYSGGMRRRLEIARGLLHHPSIFFLDEPTIGLDPQTRNQMWQYVEKLNKEENITVFLTTHYMEEAERVAQRIAIIDHGNIIAMGTAQELKKKTNTDNLEDAFLSLTGRAIREEEAAASSRMAMRIRMRARGR